MKPKKKSISQRMKYCKSFQAQKKALTDWSKGWFDDQYSVINKLYNAVEDNDYDVSMRLIAQLRGLTEKRFIGLNSVIEFVCDPERHLEVLPKPETTVEKIQTEKMDTDSLEDMYNEIVRCYNAGISVREIAVLSEISPKTVIKMLVTKGVYSSEKYDKIKELREKGKNDSQIMAAMDITQKDLNTYTPYTRGKYKF